MKKLIKTIILLTLILLIAGCGTQIQKTNNKNDNSLDNAIKLIKQGKYDDAYSIVNKNKDETSQVLVNYINAIYEEQTKGETDKPIIPEIWLADIPDNYNGVLSKEINQMKAKYSEQIKETRRIREEQRKNPLPDTKLNPSIGMTVDEVKKSSWGEPQHINRTTTANGVSEQWVYDGSNFHSGYIYFEDGKVTVIQN